METGPFIVNKIGKVFTYLPIIAHAFYYSQSSYWIIEISVKSGKEFGHTQGEIKKNNLQKSEFKRGWNSENHQNWWFLSFTLSFLFRERLHCCYIDFHCTCLYSYYNSSRALHIVKDVGTKWSFPSIRPVVDPSIRPVHPSVKKMKKKMGSQLWLLWHDDEAIIENQRRGVAGGGEEAIQLGFGVCRQAEAKN